MTDISLIASITLGPVAVIGYVCLAVKAGFIVSDWTEDTGFDAGFYMMVVVGLIALPFAIAVAVFS